MEGEFDKIYNASVEQLRKRKDFETIDLDMVKNYALTMVMFRDFPDEDLEPVLLQVKNFGNHIAEILDLPKIGPTDSKGHTDLPSEP